MYRERIAHLLTRIAHYEGAGQFQIADAYRVALSRLVEQAPVRIPVTTR